MCPADADSVTSAGRECSGLGACDAEPVLFLCLVRLPEQLFYCLNWYEACAIDEDTWKTAIGNKLVDFCFAKAQRYLSLSDPKRPTGERCRRWIVRVRHVSSPCLLVR